MNGYDGKGNSLELVVLIAGKWPNKSIGVREENKIKIYRRHRHEVHR
jgi:hypothetical protein